MYKLYLKDIGIVINWMIYYDVTSLNVIKKSKWYFVDKNEQPYFCYSKNNKFIELINSIKDYEFF